MASGLQLAPDGWLSEEEDKENKDNKDERRKRLHLSLKQKLDHKRQERFRLTSPKKLCELSSYNPPANTKVNTSWAMHNFEQWFEWRSSGSHEEICPQEVLSPSCSAKVLRKWLPSYITETRNKEGQPYPPKTLYSLLTGILRHMSAQNPHYPNFLQKKSAPFVEFHRCLDNYFRKLRTEGIGAESKHTPMITIEEENILWEKGVLNTSSPHGLLNAVFYYNGKNFILRGGQEHRDLKLSMLIRKTQPDRYIYVENASKNRGGGLGQLRVEHKKVPIHSNSDAGERCHVYLLDLYISRLPPAVKEKDFFYCKPLQKFTKSGPWFSSIPCGKNTLSKMVSVMFREAGLEDKTNHSLRTAGISRLYEAGVDEKIIQSRSGHRQLESLCTYECVSPMQVEAVSKVLSSSERVSYRSALQQEQQSTGLVEETAEKVPLPSLPEMNPAVPTLTPRSGIVQYSACTFNITYNKEQ